MEKQKNNLGMKKYSLRELTQIAFQIIVKAGAGKSDAMEAIFAAKDGDFALAASKIAAAHENLVAAEKEHFELIQQEASGNEIKVPLILMHAEDQLLSSQTVAILAEELVELHKRLSQKK